MFMYLKFNMELQMNIFKDITHETYTEDPQFNSSRYAYLFILVKDNKVFMVSNNNSLSFPQISKLVCSEMNDAFFCVFGIPITNCDIRYRFNSKLYHVVYVNTYSKKISEKFTRVKTNKLGKKRVKVSRYYLVNDKTLNLINLI